MTDKMDKKVRSSMLDDLLSDGDKKKDPPKPTYSGGYGSSYGYQGGTYSNGRSRDLFDDGGPDPLDDDYYSGTRRSRSYSPPPRKTDYSVPRTSIQGYNRRAVETPADKILMAFDDSYESGGRVYIDDKAKAKIIDAMMISLSLTLDQASMFWMTDGTKLMRAAFDDLVTNFMYLNTCKVVVADIDQDTGEIKEDGEA